MEHERKSFILLFFLFLLLAHNFTISCISLFVSVGLQVCHPSERCLPNKARFQADISRLAFFLSTSPPSFDRTEFVIPGLRSPHGLESNSSCFGKAPI